MDNLQLLILKKQYEILSILEPANRAHEIAVKAIESGFELEIEQLIENAVVEPVSTEICREVRDIFDMYRNMQNSLKELDVSEELRSESLFPGFDGNQETAHYAYALFLIEDRGLWQGLTTRDQTWNSHQPHLHGYKAMLREFHKTKRYPLTVEQIKRVLAAYWE